MLLLGDYARIERGAEYHRRDEQRDEAPQNAGHE
jgi:hypothetical protein